MLQEIYLAHVEREIPRLLSWQDREVFSKTYGSFDRVYWGWKFTDFPGARFQEGVFPLVYLYKKNPNPQLLEWIRAGIANWRNLQYKDGSFDEAYPFEKSLAAASFTGFYVGLAFQEVSSLLTDTERAETIESFSRLGRWLCKNDETHGVLTNHLAAAAAALRVAYKICGDEKFDERSRYFLKRIYDHQSQEEGWYEEYGGADPGYQTHSTSYLAWLWKDTKDAELLKSLERSLEFLKYFVHPNGTIGGEYASRNTEFYYPAGFEMLAGVSQNARAIALKMRESVKNQTVAGLQAMDSYNFLPLMNSYLLAAENVQDHAVETKLPCDSNEKREFPKAGIAVYSNANYYAVFGASKGGVLRVYSKETRKLAFSDCGYILKIEGTKGWFSSQGLHSRYFVAVNQRIQTTPLFLGFRIFSTTLGRIPALSSLLKKILVRMLVTKRKTVPITLSRNVVFGTDSIEYSDRIVLEKPLRVSALKRGKKFSTIHMGSSRYFQAQEFDSKKEAWEENPEWLTHLERSGNLDLHQTFEISQVSSPLPLEITKDSEFSTNF